MGSKKPIVLGKLGKPFGVKGWLKVTSYTHPPRNILDYQPWLLQHKHQWQPIHVENAAMHGQSITVKLPQINTPEDAKLWTNTEIGIFREQLPDTDENEYYWSDLEGLNVVTVDGKTLGKVQRLFATGANDILIVRGEQEHLIPYLFGDTIKNVDLYKGEILVDWEPLIL